MAHKTMTAKFAGICKGCKGPIAAGELITWAAGYGAQHATLAQCDAAKAAKAVAAAAPKPSKTMDASAIAIFLRMARERGLKFPKVRFAAAGGAELLLTLAGPQSKNPGAVFVKLAGFYLGSIAVDGAVRGELARRDDILSTLATIATDPAKAAKEYGALTCRCSFCGKGLTDEGSVEVGYGPVCADKYGLPHKPKGTPTLKPVVDNGIVSMGGKFAEPDGVDYADSYYSARLGF